MKKKRLILRVTIGGRSRLLDGQAAYFKNLGYEEAKKELRQKIV
jgi:hypothetical protein